MSDNNNSTIIIPKTDFNFLKTDENENSVIELENLWDELINIKFIDFKEGKFKRTISSAFNTTSRIIDLLLALLNKAEDLLIQNPKKEEDYLFNIYINEFRMESIRTVNNIFGIIGTPRFNKLYKGIRRYNFSNLTPCGVFTRILRSDKYKPFKEQHDITTVPTIPFDDNTINAITDSIKQYNPIKKD